MYMFKSKFVSYQMGSFDQTLTMYHRPMIHFLFLRPRQHIHLYIVVTVFEGTKPCRIKVLQSGSPDATYIMGSFRAGFIWVYGGLWFTVHTYPQRSE